MDKIPVIKGREQDIKISGRYEKRKDMSDNKEREYLDISKERKNKKNNGKREKKESELPENKYKSKYSEPEVNSATINRPRKSNKKTDKSEIKESSRGINKKDNAKFFKKSIKSTIGSKDNIVDNNDEIQEPQDMNTNTETYVNKIYKITVVIVSKLLSLAASIATTFLATFGIIALIGILASILAMVCLRSVTYDFIVDEEKNLRETISQINSEFIGQMEKIAEEGNCTGIETQGQLSSWKDIIAFWWTCNVNKDKIDKWDDFFSGNDFDDLKKLFYEFNQVTSEIKEDENKKILLVTIRRRSMDEMIKDYGLSSNQVKYLNNLLKAEEIWKKIFSSDELASVAAGEIAASKNRYYKWYPLDEEEKNWNMAFVSYCLDKAGYFVPGCLTKTNDIDSFINELTKKGYMKPFSKESGDIIFLNISGEIKAGIVNRVEDDAYYVILGEYYDSDVVCEITVAKGSGLIKGFAKIEAFNVTLGEESADVVKIGDLVWPASGQYYVTSCFKWRWGRQHQGIDIGCPEGTPVLAAADGTVILSQYSNSAGYYIMIDHGDCITVYMHNSQLKVVVGETVVAGQVISLSGNTGNSTGPHLHFGVSVNNSYVDPAPYLGIPSNFEGDAAVYFK